MSDWPHDELLSAYLDGELTADQQAQVERRLASDPRARQLLDELRALRATLQELPEQQLDEDLGPAVLRLAERRMLAEPSSAAQPRPASRVRQMFAIVGRRLFNARGVAWAAVTLLVAALLWINQQGRQRQVAQAPPGTPEAATGSTAPADHEPPVIRAAPGAESAQMTAEAAHEDRDAAERPAGELSSAGGEAAEPLPSKAAGGARSTAPAPPAEAAPAQAQLAETPGAGEQAPTHTLLAKAPGQPPAAPAAAPPAPLAEALEPGVQADAAPAAVPGQPSAPAAQPPYPLPGKAGPEAALARAGSSLAQAGQGFAGEQKQAGMGFGTGGETAAPRDEAGAAPAAQSEGLGDVSAEQETAQQLVDHLAGHQARATEPQVGGGLMLVYCDVSAAALQNRTLDRALLRNGIVFEEPDEQQAVQFWKAEQPEQEEVASQEPAGTGRFRQDSHSPEDLSRSTQPPPTAQTPVVGPGSSGVAGTQADRMVPESAEPVVQEPAATTEGPVAGPARQQPHDRRLATAERAPVQQIPVEAIYVEATPQQISRALDELVLQRDEVVSLSIQPAPGVAAQNTLALRYNRRAAAEDKPAGAKRAGTAESETGSRALSTAGAPENLPATETPSGAAMRTYGATAGGPTAKAPLRPQGRAQRVPLLPKSWTIQQRAREAAVEAQQYAPSPAAENAPRQQPGPQPSAGIQARSQAVQRAMELQPGPFQFQAPEQSQPASGGGQQQAAPGEGPAIRKPQTTSEGVQPAGSAACPTGSRHREGGTSRQRGAARARIGKPAAFGCGWRFVPNPGTTASALHRAPGGRSGR